MGLTAGLQVQATQDNTKTDVEEIGSENVDWIHMFQDRYKRKTFAKTVINLLLFHPATFKSNPNRWVTSNLPETFTDKCRSENHDVSTVTSSCRVFKNEK